ncbi:MAG TPA: DUF1622 domain-containing protein [Devosiaceae bacterium]|jgi:uncharacterized membrane protein|nr:DUF1622 domain-containing protein [Devosiaceae bacterium]
MWDVFETALLWITRILEAGGAGIIFIGSIVATIGYLRMVLARVDDDKRFREFRTRLARSILLGLEFLVAADIVRTVTIDFTLESLTPLALLVVIRTFLSFSLETEIEGHWPWKREPAPGEQKE